MAIGVFVDRKEADKNTLADVLSRYLVEVNPLKKGASVDTIRINRLLRDEICQFKCSGLSGKAIAQWRDQRLKCVSGATVNRELNLISVAINTARREWGVHIENPVSFIKRPSNGKARTRRLTPTEEAELLRLDIITARKSMEKGGVA